MTIFQKSLREAGNFARSLLSENYKPVIQVVSEHDKSAFIKLRHCRNRNTIIIATHSKGWHAFKNNKLIKVVDYSETSSTLYKP